MYQKSLKTYIIDAKQIKKHRFSKCETNSKQKYKKYSNHYLISKGKGIIVIPAELTQEFKDLLIPYYEGKDENKIREFIKEKCYIGI